MSVHTDLMCSRQASFVPLVPVLRQPFGKALLVGQTEYCPSSFTTASKSLYGTSCSMIQLSRKERRLAPGAMLRGRLKLA